MQDPYHNRSIYRSLSLNKNHLRSFRITIKETDLLIKASKKNLYKKAEKKIMEVRAGIKDYIKKNPDFLTSLVPLKKNKSKNPVIDNMLKASKKANLGPMAAVAGAFSQEVGNHLLKFCNEVIIENGGDIFIKTDSESITGIYAGKNSPFSNKVGIRLKKNSSFGICTSSGTFGHSLSFGNADAVSVISENAYTADAFATALCNMVKSCDDIEKTLDFASEQNDITGVVIVFREKIGAVGDLELVNIQEKG